MKLRFVGYSIQSKACRLLDEKTSKVHIRRDFIFNEDIYQEKLHVKSNLKLRLTKQQSKASRPNLKN